MRDRRPCGIRAMRVSACAGGSRHQAFACAFPGLAARACDQPKRNLSARIVAASANVIALDTIIGHDCSTTP